MQGEAMEKVETTHFFSIIQFALQWGRKKEKKKKKHIFIDWVN